MSRVKNIIFKSGNEAPASEFIRNICKFVVNECIDGDYYEFGVYQGNTLSSFYKQMQSVSDKRLKRTDFSKESSAYNKRSAIKHDMIFHAFDSFEGLPQLAESDIGTLDFHEGQYSAGEDFVRKLLLETGMNEERFRLHKGWFQQTCNHDYFRSFSFKPASVIWLDCDLYSSAKDALEVLPIILQPGTVIIIDDWFCFKGDPKRGVRAAWSEFVCSPSISKKYGFTEYLQDSWSKKAFICYSKGD